LKPTAPAFSLHLARVYWKAGNPAAAKRTWQHVMDEIPKAQGWRRSTPLADRHKGQSHACALRCLGMRWLKILAAMIRSHTPYDAALHARSQLQHGSWVLQLHPKLSTNQDAS